MCVSGLFMIVQGAWLFKLKVVLFFGVTDFQYGFNQTPSLYLIWLLSVLPIKRNATTPDTTAKQ